MRQFKFRVYAHCDEGMKMVYLDPIECDNGLWFSSKEHIDDYGDKIMQYTGLKDKNGTEIYEGDILRDEHGSKGAVVWDKSEFVVVFDTNDVMGQIDGWAEVCGNIYESTNQPIKV